MVKLSPLARLAPPPGGRRLARRARKVGGLAPNVLTVMGLCAGLSAIRFGLEGNLQFAALAVLAAHLFDILDGRFARLLDVSNRFGEILDSLADFLNFGIAPVLILHQWQLAGLGNVGWIACLFFVVCCALRLARFSASEGEAEEAPWRKGYFVGLPAPAAANVALAPVYLHLAGAAGAEEWRPFVAALLVGTGVLMVSRVPFYSGKSMEFSVVRRVRMPLLLAGLSLGLALLVYYTWAVLLALVAAYLGSVPFSMRGYRARVALERVDGG